MRVISVEEESSSSRVVVWGLAGAAVGIAAGVLLSEKLSGRAGGARTLWRRARSLAKVAGAQWLPWLELALELKEQWFDSDSADDDNSDDNGFTAEDAEDDGDDEDGDDEDGDNDDDLEDLVPDVIGARVLEAFLNDPVLSERAVEIQADPEGAVLLHGRVLTAREVAHAVTIAGGVPGVTDVRQRLRVRHRR